MCRQAFEQLVDEGKVKHIGVSNFSLTQIEELLEFARIKPVVNQIELHPALAQRKLVGVCLRKVCYITNSSPPYQARHYLNLVLFICMRNVSSLAAHMSSEQSGKLHDKIIHIYDLPWTSWDVAYCVWATFCFSCHSILFQGNQQCVSLTYLTSYAFAGHCQCRF